MARFLCLIVLAFAPVAKAGAPFLFPGLSRRALKPNPAAAALRDYSATLHTNLGDLSVRFYPDEAPNAVRNFIKLAQQGFYDGARVYCVFNDRMFLVGDPTGTGKGDNGTTIPHERTFAPITAGALLMDLAPERPAKKRGAKPEKRNSGSRFMVCVADQRHLDGDFTVFGAIADGLDIAKRIGAAATKPNDGRPAPIEDLLIERITITKKTKKPPKPKESEGG